MMSREALEQVGIFDEEFFQVNEDVDWCIRARKLGYRVVYVDTAAIHHRGASSADLSQPIVFSYGYFLGRNAILFAKKHANPLQFAWLLAMMVLGVTMRISAFALRRHPRHPRPGALHLRHGRRPRRPPAPREDHRPHADPRGELPDTPVVRILRWLGA